MERLDPDRFRPAILERGPSCAGATDVGPVRERNEDAYWIADHGAALVVADGLGGLPNGDVASALAVAAVAEVLADEMSGEGALRSTNSASDAEGVGTRLERIARGAAAHAQRRVLEAVSRRQALRGMATTLVVALVEAGEAVILHVGDSRAALWRGGRCIRKTFDHNEVGDLVRAGALTAEQARHHPSRHMVREVVGLSEGYQAECQTWQVEPGDILLLCTDGLSDALSEEAIARVLASTRSAAAAAATLVAVAGIESGHDNATVIVRYVT
jgi:protein phosphatase